MSEFVRISSIWYEILPIQQFSAMFDILFLPWTEFVDFILIDGFVSLLIGEGVFIRQIRVFIDMVVDLLKLFPFGQIPTIAVLCGSFIFIVLSLHILKLIVEALPIF